MQRSAFHVALFFAFGASGCAPALAPVAAPTPEVKSLDHFVKSKAETDAMLKRCATLSKPDDDQNCKNAEQASIAHMAKPLGTTEFTKKKHQ
jgi:hypothetical protein